MIREATPWGTGTLGLISRSPEKSKQKCVGLTVINEASEGRLLLGEKKGCISGKGPHHIALDSLGRNLASEEWNRRPAFPVFLALFYT